MSKKEIEKIVGFKVYSAGKLLRLDGKGRSLPVYNFYWSDVAEAFGIKEGEIDFSSFEAMRESKDRIKKEYISAVAKECSKAVERLEKAGYTVEDPIVLTDVYEYWAYFIYK